MRGDFGESPLAESYSNLARMQVSAGDLDSAVAWGNEFDDRRLRMAILTAAADGLLDDAEAGGKGVAPRLERRPQVMPPLPPTTPFPTTMPSP